MKRIFLFLSLILIFCPNCFSAQLSPSDFAKEYIYQDAKLSPDGKKLGLIALIKGRRSLFVLDPVSLETLGSFSLGTSKEVGEFYWATSKRIVAERWHREPWQSQAKNYGELFAIDYTGKNSEMIYGFLAGERATGSKLNKKEAVFGWAEVLHLLPDDKKHILISSTQMSDHGGSFPTIHKLNIHSGKLGRAITRSPVPYASFLTNAQGELKFVTGTTADYKQVTFKYEDKKWVEISNDVGSSFTPLALSDNDQSVLFIDNKGQDKDGLFKMNLNTGLVSEIYTDSNVDVTNVNYTTDKNNVYAARIDDGRPSYVILDKGSEDANIFKRLLATFQGYSVTVTSKSEDGNLWVVYVRNDIDAGTYYLFNSEKNALSQLVSNHEHIDINTLSETQPVTFDSFDGVTIHGYITYPLTAPENIKVPLITLIHGGPHGERDYWYYNAETQMLASQGYAVLQVNFRGSGGYGNNYEASGYRHWGSDIQNDIIKGTKWAVSQGRIDSDKICAMGGSFGGYSAIMSAILEPNLFKCVVTNAGVYDLELMRKKGDIPDLLWGEHYLDSAIGEDYEILASFSPVNHTESLKAPILIAHGKKDRRVPYTQAESLIKALDKNNKSYELFIKPKETHGFYDEKNRMEYFNKVAVFLDKYLN